MFKIYLSLTEKTRQLCADNDHIYTAQLNVLPGIMAAEAALKYTNDFPKFLNDCYDTFSPRKMIQIIMLGPLVGVTCAIDSYDIPLTELYLLGDASGML